jgi:hypothetical protein
MFCIKFTVFCKSTGKSYFVKYYECITQGSLLKVIYYIINTFTVLKTRRIQ